MSIYQIQLVRYIKCEFFNLMIHLLNVVFLVGYLELSMLLLVLMELVIFNLLMLRSMILHMSYLLEEFLLLLFLTMEVL